MHVSQLPLILSFGGWENREKRALARFYLSLDQKPILSRKYREDHALELIWGHVSSLGRWVLESG